MIDPRQDADEPVDTRAPSGGWRLLYQSEDWWAIWIGGVLLAVCLIAVLATGASEDGSYASPLKKWLAKPGSWSSNPVDAFFVSGKTNVWPGLAGVFLISLLAFGTGVTVMGKRFTSFAAGFCYVFGLGTIAYVLAGQEVVKHYNLGYALWALASGLFS